MQEQINNANEYDKWRAYLWQRDAVAILEAGDQCSPRHYHLLLQPLGDSLGCGYPANGWPWQQQDLDDEEGVYLPYQGGTQPYHLAGVVEETYS